MPDHGSYSHKEVCAKVGLSGRQVIDWAEKGVVRPEVADTVGAGRPRRYSEDNLVEFVLAKELIAAGFTVRRTERFLRFLKNRPTSLLRNLGGLRLAKSATGQFQVSGMTFRGHDPWRAFAARSGPRDESVVWIVLDLDAARRRLGL
jgi:DNA-binding transcriptional MerR regulator